MPRPVVTDTGLRGPGQEVWTEAMKATVRNMVFIEGYVTVLREEDEDEGGSQGDWKQIGTYDGRLDNVGSAGGRAKDFGDSVHEITAHVLSTEPAADVRATDRFIIEGRIWIATSESVRTSQASKQLQVEELHG